MEKHTSSWSQNVCIDLANNSKSLPCNTANHNHFLFFVTWNEVCKPNSFSCAELKYVVRFFSMRKRFEVTSDGSLKKTCIYIILQTVYALQHKVTLDYFLLYFACGTSKCSAIIRQHTVTQLAFVLLYIGVNILLKSLSVLNALCPDNFGKKIGPSKGTLQPVALYDCTRSDTISLYISNSRFLPIYWWKLKQSLYRTGEALGVPLDSDSHISR